MGSTVLLGWILTLSEALAILGAALIVAIIGYAGYQYARRYGSGGRILGDRCRETLASWAASRGLRFDAHLLRIAGAADGIDVLVTATYDQIEWSLPPSIMMSTISNHPLPVTVQIATSWFSLEEQIAQHRAHLDDPEFETRFKIWADPPDAPALLLDGRMRERMLALAPEEMLYDRGVVELRWDDEFVDSTERAARRLDEAFEIVVALAHAGADRHPEIT